MGDPGSKLGSNLDSDSWGNDSWGSDSRGNDLWSNDLWSRLWRTLGTLRMGVLGDVMLDHYVQGEIRRISPEAPVPVLQVKADSWRAGGAANVMINLVHLGCRVRGMGLIGADEDGRRLCALLQEQGVDTQAMDADASRCTTQKERVLALQQQLIRVDRETVAPPTESQQCAWKEQLMTMLSPGASGGEAIDGLIISDYAKGVCTEALLREVLPYAAAQRKVVLVDPKGGDYRKYAGASVITPNASEASTATGVTLNAEEDIARAAVMVQQRARSEAVCITLGARGVFALAPDGERRLFPAQAQDVYDVTGAGDTFISVLGAALAAEHPFFAAVELANVAAGLAVSRLGTGGVRAAVLRQAFGRAPKTIAPQALPTLLTQLRAAGLRIVFTNGCFDLLHLGHVRYLQASKREGDVLIVGVNDDHSVRRLKGRGRPLQPLAQRQELLTALQDVDYVTHFSEDTPLQLIESIRPAVITKGADYTRTQVVGGDLVEREGGRVVIIPLVDGLSTSSLVERIQEQNR